MTAKYTTPRINLQKIQKYKYELDNLVSDKDADPEIIEWLNNNYLKLNGKNIWDYSQEEQFQIITQAYNTVSGMLDPKLKPKKEKVKKKYRKSIPVDLLNEVSGGINIVEGYKNKLNVAGDSLIFNSDAEYNDFRRDLKPLKYDVKSQKIQLEGKSDREKWRSSIKHFERAIKDGSWDNAEHYLNKLTVIRPSVGDSLNTVLTKSKANQPPPKGFWKKLLTWDW